MTLKVPKSAGAKLDLRSGRPRRSIEGRRVNLRDIRFLSVLSQLVNSMIRSSIYRSSGVGYPGC